jgi:hypothetical protein
LQPSGLISLEIENALYSEARELDSVTLTRDKARELATALVTAADSIKYMRRSSTNSVDWAETATALCQKVSSKNY